jgi:hypothetical protein
LVAGAVGSRPPARVEAAAARRRVVAAALPLSAAGAVPVLAAEAE